jgi:hypothetical protein
LLVCRGFSLTMNLRGRSDCYIQRARDDPKVRFEATTLLADRGLLDDQLAANLLVVFPGGDSYERKEAASAIKGLLGSE